MDNNKVEAEVKRDLELLCVIARSMAQIEVRLGNLSANNERLGNIETLLQQLVDLSRRERREA